jgi:hypothetical protein
MRYTFVCIVLCRGHIAFCYRKTGRNHLCAVIPCWIEKRTRGTFPCSFVIDATACSWKLYLRIWRRRVRCAVYGLSGRHRGAVGRHKLSFGTPRKRFVHSEQFGFCRSVKLGKGKSSSSRAARWKLGEWGRGRPYGQLTILSCRMIRYTDLCRGSRIIGHCVLELGKDPFGYKGRVPMTLQTYGWKGFVPCLRTSFVIVFEFRHLLLLHKKLMQRMS